MAIDPERLKLALENADAMADVTQTKVERIAELLFGEVASGIKEVKDRFGDLGRSVTYIKDDVEEALVDPFETGLLAAERFKTKMKQTLADIVKDAQEQFSKMSDDRNRALGYLKGTVQRRALQGTDGSGGLITGATTAANRALSQLPFGGIFGVMMFGRMQEASFFAKAQQAGQVFQNAGSVSRRIIGQLTGDIRTLEQSIPGIGSAFAAAGSSAATMGFTAREAGELTSTAIKGASNTVLNLSVAMDKFFEAGDGASMKFAGSIATNVNGALRESTELVRDIGLSVQDTGISFNTMLGSVMQVTSALRLQMNELDEAESTTNAILQAQRGLQAQGLNAVSAGAIAASGVEGVAQAISGMDVGLKAVLGERMGGGRGLDAVMRFEQGFRGSEDPQFFNKSLEEIINLSSELGKGDPARQYQVLKSLFNMSAEQAQVLMAIQDSGKEGVSISAAAEKHQDALTRAFKDEGLKKSTFEVMMNRLIQVVAKVGSALLDAIVSGLEMLVASTAYLANYLTVGTTEREDIAYQRYMLLAGKNAERGFSNAYSALTESKDIAKLFGETILQRSPALQSASSTFMREATARGERTSAADDISNAVFGIGSKRKRPKVTQDNIPLPDPNWKAKFNGKLPDGSRITGDFRIEAPATGS